MLVPFFLFLLFEKLVGTSNIWNRIDTYIYIEQDLRYFMEQLNDNEGVYMQTRRRLAEP